jgi:general secretion pathway protein G
MLKRKDMNLMKSFPLLPRKFNLKLRKLSRRGMTLIEIMVVLVIIGFIGTFAVTKIQSQLKKARLDTTKQMIRSLGAALDAYKLDCGSYPKNDEGKLDALIQGKGPASCKNINPEGYLKQVPKDGFGGEFEYESTDGVEYEIISLGEDKKVGGEAFAADTSSKDMI